MKLAYTTLGVVIWLLGQSQAFACSEINVDVTGYVSTRQEIASTLDDLRLDGGNRHSFLVRLQLDEVGFPETDMTLLFRRIKKHTWKVDFINDLMSVPIKDRQLIGGAGTITFKEDGTQVSPIWFFTLPMSGTDKEPGSTITVTLHDIQLTGGLGDIEAKLAVSDNVRCSDHGKLVSFKNKADPAVNDELNPITKNAERAFIREQ